MNSKKSEIEIDIDYKGSENTVYSNQYKDFVEEFVEFPQVTGGTSEVDNPYVIIDKLIERNWSLEGQLKDLERDYKEEYKKLVRENTENIKKYEKQINSFEIKIDTLIKSKERRFGISDTLIEDKIKDYLEQEKEESNI